MIPTSVTNAIKSIAGQGLSIPVRDGLSTDSMETPVITVSPQSMEKFTSSLVDVFHVYVSVKYEEHYADVTTDRARNNFDTLVNNFNRDNLIDNMQGSNYHVFESRIESGSVDVVNDILVHEVVLYLIMELKS
jgi:hypothetical protein